MYTTLKDSGEISGKRRYLFVEELPNEYVIKKISMNCDPTFSGMVFDEADSHMGNINVPLDMAIQGEQLGSCGWKFT